MQYWVSVACGWDAGAGVCALPARSRRKIAATENASLLVLVIRFDVLRSQVAFDEFNRAGFRHARMRRQENTLRPGQRRPPFVVLHVEPGAFFDKELDDGIRTGPIGC